MNRLTIAIVLPLLMAGGMAQARLGNAALAGIWKKPLGQKLFRAVTGAEMPATSAERSEIFKRHYGALKGGRHGGGAAKLRRDVRPSAPVVGPGGFAFAGGGGLAMEIDKVAEAIAAGRGSASMVASLRAKLAGGPARPARESAKGSGTLSLLSGAAPASPTEKALAFLSRRVAKGEITPGAFSSFKETLVRFKAALGEPLLGPGAGECMRTYSPGLVANFMSLVSVLRGGALASFETAFGAMAARAERVFPHARGPHSMSARERVCGLAGHGYSCRLTNPRLCVL